MARCNLVMDAGGNLLLAGMRAGREPARSLLDPTGQLALVAGGRRARQQLRLSGRPPRRLLERPAGETVQPAPHPERDTAKTRRAWVRSAPATPASAHRTARKAGR